ncbi:hypothetical protein H6F88_22405 [Oculatella sp. FACHB-28]|uniref:hypothetical protein n=1 Tax=Oculatella sp. FACHB-28 TaxID=2692845 RepID=UPI0016897C75|nr:hypothetical protein [Oculatella sp. FACHB-28]MBD2058716.1 hypothetical protein [Oculatella sp. FACHB-28]
MEYWEFLLQKEGDRSWLPLESPSVEILEGRYRVVARSSRVRTPVEIRVIHDATVEMPPKLRVQKRSGQTNREGLLVVIPFTRLQPGRWELRCTSDLMADMIGESWEYAVQLQVLYNDPEVDDWEPDWEGSGSESLAEATGASAAQAFHSQVQPAQPAQNGAIAPSTPLPQAEPTQPSAPALEPVVATSDTASQVAPDEIVAETAESGIAASEPTFIQAETQADEPLSFEPEQSVEEVTEATEITAVQLEQVEQVPLEVETQISETLSDESADGLLSDDATSESEETEMAIAQEGAIAAINAAAAELADSLAESMDVANAAPDVEVTQPTEALPESLDASSLRQAAEQMSEKVVEAIFEEYDPEKFDQTLNQTIDEAVESILKEFEAGSAPVYPAIEQAGESVDETTNLSTFTAPLLENATAVASPQLQITLERESYVVRRGRSFNLVGQVELLSESKVNPTVRVSKMQIRLHDPKTSHVVAEVHQPLADKAVPFSFSCPIATPAQGQTHLFLGEVLLYAVPKVGVPTKVLATQSFTVAADMEELLEAIATEPTPLDLQTPLAFANDTDILNLEFLDLLNSPGSVVQFQPSNASSLPPQLYPAKPGEVPAKPLELPLANDPNFTLSGNAEAVKQFLLTKTQTPEASETPFELPEELIDESPEELAQTIANLELVEVFEADSEVSPESASMNESPAEEVDSFTETIAENISNAVETPEIDAPEILSEGEEGDRPEIPVTNHSSIPERQPEPATEPLKTQDRAFPTAKLKNRFWSRLNSLATDADPADSLNAPSDQSPFVDGITLGVDADLVAQEVVVDDDLPPARFRNGRWERQSDTTLALPDEEPVPTPQIELPTGELTAGKSVCVIVKLPALTPRIYVKLWLHDRQTRSLLDGPHWLMNFLPNGSGEMEVRTQLTVPFGCFEIQFEAIAIEMATQRESHKIIVDRMVMPPDLPTLSLDELDVYKD